MRSRVDWPVVAMFAAVGALYALAWALGRR